MFVLVGLGFVWVGLLFVLVGLLIVSVGLCLFRFNLFFLLQMIWNIFSEVCFNFFPWNDLLSISIFLIMVRNRIPKVFSSTEQPDFCRNKPFVPSIPPSAE